MQPGTAMLTGIGPLCPGAELNGGSGVAMATLSQSSATFTIVFPLKQTVAAIVLLSEIFQPF